MPDTGIFNIQPPAWLQRNTTADWFKLGESTGETVTNLAKTIGVMSSQKFQSQEQGQNFFHKMMDASATASDPFYMEKAEAFHSQAQLQQATRKDQLQGMKEYADWMKDTGGDWKKVMSTDFTGTSAAGAELAAKQKQQAWMRWTQEQAIEVKKTEAQNKLDVAEMNANTARQKILATKDIAAEKASIERAKVESIKAGFTPQIVQYGDAKLVQISPNRWQYVRGQTAKDMTPTQMQTFANSLDDDDINKPLLLKAAEVMAVRQATGKKTTPVAAPPKAEFNYDPASGDFVPVTQ